MQTCLILALYKHSRGGLMRNHFRIQPFNLLGMKKMKFYNEDKLLYYFFL